MSIRTRLTLWMSLLSGGLLTVFAVIVYMAASVFVFDWVDTQLSQTADQTLLRLSTVGPDQFDVFSVSGTVNNNVFIIQLWGLDGRLDYSSIAGDQQPLDNQGWQVWKPVFTTVNGDYGHTRVLSVPLETQRGAVGMLVVGYPLATLDLILQVLLSILSITAVLLLLAAGSVSWWFSAITLRPLRQVTDVLPRILEANDLSRRIPEQIAPKDEVGRLVQMINNMLERLEQLLSTQRRFLADVSHELRTPLTVIKGEVGLLRKIGELDPESLHSIESEVDRLSRLVGDLLLLGQAESGKLLLDQVPIELERLLTEVLQPMEKLVAGRLDLRAVEVEPVTVMGDHDRLKQVLINLISNAIQHTPNGGSVSITLRSSGDGAQLSIRDTGSGIPAEDLPHIFERFYRGEKSRKRTPGGGFGLGLSISYWIVRNHGGTIDVTSHEGVGTTFVVWLPRKM